MAVNHYLDKRVPKRKVWLSWLHTTQKHLLQTSKDCKTKLACAELEEDTRRQTCCRTFTGG